MDNLITYLAKKFNINARYFINGGFWLLVAQASTVVCSLIVAVLMARFLPETDYGIYKYVIGLAAMLSVFSLTGISQSILQATSNGNKNFLEASTLISLKYSLGVTVSALAGSIYYFNAGNEILTLGCLMIAVLHPPTQLFINAQSYLYGELKFATGAHMQTAKSIFVSGTTLVTLFITHNIILLLAVYFASQAIISIASYYYYKPRLVETTTVTKEVWNKYIAYAKNTSYRNILLGIASRLDSIIIFQHLGAAELALYSVTTLIPDQVRSSLKNLQTLLIPKYTKHESIGTLKKFIPKRSIQFLFLLIIITLLFIVVIPPIYTYLFPKYAEGAQYLQLLALTFPATIFLIPLGALQAQHKEKELYVYHVSTSILQILLLVVLVYKFDFIGAIIARIIAQYARAFTAYLLLFKSHD